MGWRWEEVGEESMWVPVGHGRNLTFTLKEMGATLDCGPHYLLREDFCNQRETF